jgi:hypothetical protein
MIVVKVYLWPGGDRTRERELASAEIANISDLAPASTYAVLAAEHGSLICAVALKAARQFNEGKGRKAA